MNKKEIIISFSVLVLAIVIVGYLLLRSKTPPQSAEDINRIVNQGVLPSLGETNPMKNKPDVNPVDASNPFRSIKTNPFQ